LEYILIVLSLLSDSTGLKWHRISAQPNAQDVVGSNFRDKGASMKHTQLIFFLLPLLACSNNINQQAQTEHIFSLSNISVIDANFPLRLSEINLHDRQSVIHLNDDMENQIFQTIYSYYFNDCSGDSSETYFKVKDTYIRTIRLKDSLHTIFFVLLNHMPDGLVNGKVLFYNNLSKEFIDQVFDFNVQALYDYTDGKLKSSNLKEKFKINSPEIELMHDNKSKTSNFKFTKLYHNGTSNAIETAILQVKNHKLDTIDFKQKWLTN
jgi:hypothetical protein